MKTIIKMISKHSRKQRKIRKREEEQKKIDNELNIYNIAQEIYNSLYTTETVRLETKTKEMINFKIERRKNGYINRF